MAVPQRKVSKSKSLIKAFNKIEVAVPSIESSTKSSISFFAKRYPNRLKKFDTLNTKKSGMGSFATAYSFFKSRTMSVGFFKEC